MYADALPDQLDLVHLGLGPDGHTASLVPGDPVLAMLDRDVAVTGVYQGRTRMTLTYPALNRARQILWLVTGEDKVDALRRLREGDQSIPAAWISSGECARRRRRGCGRICAHERSTKERKYPVEPRAPAVLAVDVGGSHVKEVLNGLDERRRFASGDELTRRADGRRRPRADGRLGLRRRVGRRPGARGRRPVVREPVNLGDGLGRIRLRGCVRQADEGDQRRGDAGAGQLRRRAHALPRARHRARHDAHHRRVRRPDGGPAHAVPKGDVRGLRRREGARAPRRQALAEGAARGDRRLRRRRSRPTTSCSAAETHARSASCRRTAGSATTRTRSSAASASGSSPTRTGVRRAMPVAADRRRRGRGARRLWRIGRRRTPSSGCDDRSRDAVPERRPVGRRPRGCRPLGREAFGCEPRPHTNLSGGTSQEANLSVAQIVETDLSDADLTRANLRAPDHGDEPGRRRLSAARSANRTGRSTTPSCPATERSRHRTRRDDARKRRRGGGDVVRHRGSRVRGR